MADEQEDQTIAVDTKRVTAWNRWFQDRQQKLKQLKESDPLFRDNDLLKQSQDKEGKHQNQKISSNEPLERSYKKLNIPSIKSTEKYKQVEIKPIAEALREASLKEKDKKIISYDCFTNQSNAKLMEWLEEFKPLKIRQQRKDVGSIVIYGFEKDEKQLSDFKNKFEMNSSESQEKHAKLIEDWDNTIKNSEATITYSTICDLAKKYGILGGKWLFPLHHHTVNVVWKNICHEINKAAASSSRRYKSGSGNGDCLEGIPCIAAKISGGREVANMPKGTRSDNGFMALVYTTNFMDDKTIFDVEKSLRRCGIHSSMSYKPDIFSILGIYRHNKFKIRPTIYQSSWVPTKHNIYDNTDCGYENENSVIESTINEFKVACNISSGASGIGSQKPAYSSTRIDSDNSSAGTKGKLGRNIVLQVLKRKENEGKDSKRGETADEENRHNSSVEPQNGSTISVGNIPHNVTDDMIKNNLEAKYGEVIKVERRSVCYVTFKENSVVKNLSNNSDELSGKFKLGAHMLDIKQNVN